MNLLWIGYLLGNCCYFWSINVCQILHRNLVLPNACSSIKGRSVHENRMTTALAVSSNVVHPLNDRNEARIVIASPLKESTESRMHDSLLHKFAPPPECTTLDEIMTIHHHKTFFPVKRNLCKQRPANFTLCMTFREMIFLPTLYSLSCELKFAGPCGLTNRTTPEETAKHWWFWKSLVCQQILTASKQISRFWSRSSTFESKTNYLNEVIVSQGWFCIWMCTALK